MTQLGLALPDPPPVAHEWLAVGARRWCLGCEVFQHRRRGEDWPPSPASCPRSTPRAQVIDRAQRLTQADYNEAMAEIERFYPGRNDS